MLRRLSIEYMNVSNGVWGKTNTNLISILILKTYNKFITEQIFANVFCKVVCVPLTPSQNGIDVDVSKSQKWRRQFLADIREISSASRDFQR